MNEEMYEEEDDDLPMQYRRLTAHLQTGSADFNRRLSAYLTNHVAMRSALDQAITNSYAQQYPNAPQFATNNNMFPSPFLQPQHHSPQSAYPTPTTPTTPNIQPGPHGRSASVALPMRSSSYSQTVPVTPDTPGAVQDFHQYNQQRLALKPMKSKSESPPGLTRSQLVSQARPQPHQAASTANIKQDTESPKPMQAPPHRPQQPQMQPFGYTNGYPDMGPLTTALPTESQMLLAGALDSNDRFTSLLMNGSEGMPQHMDGLPPSMFSKQGNFNSPSNGMSATLAPSALDMSPHYPSNQSNNLSSWNFNFDGSMLEYNKPHTFMNMKSQSSHGSGAATPGIEGGWDSFINDSWAENAT